MLLPAFYAAQLELHFVKQAFLRSSAIIGVASLLIGTLLIDRKTRGLASDHFISIALIYLILPLIFASPFLQAYPFATPIQAYYQVLANVTTSGNPIIDLNTSFFLPFLLYSALLSWIGGLLIVVIAFAIFEPLQVGGFELVSEISGETRSRDIGGALGESNRLLHSFERVFPIYMCVTSVLFVALFANGERSLFALIDALSTISTGGIDPYMGEMTQGSPFIKEALIFLVFFLALSRATWQLHRRNGALKRIIGDPEIRAGFTIVSVFLCTFIVVMIVNHMVVRGYFPDLSVIFSSAWGALFTGLSFLLSHGTQSAYWVESELWYAEEAVVMAFLIFTFIGGGVATTASGIKLLRVYALYKLFQREMGRMADPSSIAASGRGGRALRRNGAVNAFVFMMLFMATLSTVFLGVTFFGSGFEEGLILSVSSVANCIPLVGLFPEHDIVLKEMNFGFYIVSSLGMIIGRLEVLVFMVVFSQNFWQEL